MPKMKSNRAAKKRFKVTGTGKLQREHAFASHNFSCKNRKRKRHLRKMGQVDVTEARRIRTMVQG